MSTTDLEKAWQTEAPPMSTGCHRPSREISRCARFDPSLHKPRISRTSYRQVVPRCAAYGCRRQGQSAGRLRLERLVRIYHRCPVLSEVMTQ